MLLRVIPVFCLLLSLLSCKHETKTSNNLHHDPISQAPKDTLTTSPTPSPPSPPIPPAEPDYDTKLWTELTSNDDFILDLKYAKTDNFTKQVIYPCARCFVRPQLAEKLKIIQAAYSEKNIAIKLFDCYRPRPAQQRLWDIIPDATYVANPSKGSMHNKGLAIDMTLVDSSGVELDMGTAFDHFGRESRHNYLDLDQEILDNRTLLKETMVRHGFNFIKSEWWHYSLNGTGHKSSEWEWACGD